MPRSSEVKLIISLDWGHSGISGEGVSFQIRTLSVRHTHTQEEWLISKGCEDVLEVFCHLGVCHALIPLEDTSNNAYPLAVMRGCAAGHVKAEFKTS